MPDDFDRLEPDVHVRLYGYAARTSMCSLGPSSGTCVAVPTLAEHHRGLTRAQLKNTIPSLEDRKSRYAFEDAVEDGHPFTPLPIAPEHPRTLPGWRAFENRATHEDR